jgi:hypothetical protein
MPKEQLTHPQSRSVSGSAFRKAGAGISFQNRCTNICWNARLLGTWYVVPVQNILDALFFGMEYSCFFRSPMDCFDESLHPYLKIFYQASITCNLVVEGDFMQASHRASQITSVDDGHRHRQGLRMIRSRTPQLRALAPKEMFNISHAGHRSSQITSVDDGHRHRQGLCRPALGLQSCVLQLQRRCST